MKVLQQAGFKPRPPEHAVVLRLTAEELASTPEQTTDTYEHGRNDTNTPIPDASGGCSNVSSSVTITSAPAGAVVNRVEYSLRVSHPYVTDMWLFLNNRYQFASNMEEHYHEFFVHAPIQWTQPPEEVLVLGAGDGQEALDLFKKNKKSLGLVILDMNMPGMDGAMVYDELKKIQADVRILIASGYFENHRIRNMLKNGFTGYLQKPFSIDVLSEKLAEMLAMD